MPKSKYPNKLDTSVEIPVVRDNITEIGSDVLNSLRSALFQVEKTLGVNPQGAAGNTVAARLAAALDENGNLLKSALDRSNILSGPIINEDVSKTAAIDESKLRLRYPTELLQEEISQVSNRLAVIIATLEELNRIVSAHVHEDAVNRHRAKAITTEEATAIPGTNATLALTTATVQEVLELIYNSHILYTGEGLSATNNSHTGTQIYYSNLETSDLITSNSLQGAIDDLASIEGKGLRNNTLNFNSNGIIRTGSSYDALEAAELGTTLISESSISYAGPSARSTERISFLDSPIPAGTISKFDIFTMMGSTNPNDNREYQISEVVLNSDKSLDYITVYSQPESGFQPGITGKITKAEYGNYNENALNCCVRPRYDHTNTPDIQIAMPNAATIISSGIKPSNIISGSNDTLSIKIDGEDAVDINIYDSSYSTQTIDTIVNQINQHAVGNHLNIMAYKMRSLKCYELALTHVLPNFSSDSKKRTIEVVNAASNDALSTLGLSYMLEREVEGTYGNSYHINGVLHESFGMIKEYSSASVALSTGTINISSLTKDFYEEGIRIGDLCVVAGSTDESDDGTYRVNSVSESLITLDSTGAMFGGVLSDSSKVFFMRSSCPIGELEFDEVSGDGSIMFDVFVTESQDVHYSKRMVINGNIDDPSFHAAVSDVSRNFIKDGQTATLSVSTSRYATLTDPSLAAGEPVFVGATGTYKVYSNDRMSFVILDVFTTGNPTVTLSVTLNGYDEPPDEVLHICRGSYSTDLGLILGDSGLGVPRVVDKRTTGTVDDTIISEAFIERYLQGPRNDLMGNGVIRNGVISSVDNSADDGSCLITIEPGIYVVNGTRFEHHGFQDLRYVYGTSSTDLNDFYIAIDGSGCILIENEVVDPDDSSKYISPFMDMDICHLAKIIIDTSTSNRLRDMRLHVDHVNYKLTKDIIVSNNQWFGHFTDIRSAVRYSKRFSELFPDMGSPTIHIRDGVYEVSDSILIDFDVKIKGSGPNTIIKRALSKNLGTDNTTVEALTNYIFSLGHPSLKSSMLTYGIELSDFTYQSIAPPSSTTGIDTCIRIVNDLEISGQSELSRFVIKNVSFIGHSSFNSTATSLSAAPVEIPIHIGWGASKRFENIEITGCYFDNIGFGRGVILLNDGNTFKNINVHGNISVNSINSAYSLVDISGSSLILSNIQEVANVIEHA